MTESAPPIAEMVPKLLPCPFCGDRAQLHSWEDDDVYLVACDHCDTSTRHCSCASAAIAAWNRRTPTGATP